MCVIKVVISELMNESDKNRQLSNTVLFNIGIHIFVHACVHHCAWLWG